MRAFSQSQILSRILKSMYIIYKFPGVNIDVDAYHKQKICEANEKYEVFSTKNASIVDSFRVLFENLQNDNLDLTTNLTSTNPYKHSNSLSPKSAYNAGQTYSPKLPLATANLLPISESIVLETHKEHTSPNGVNKRMTKEPSPNGSPNGTFYLPESQLPNFENGNNKLHFTLSLVPIKNEHAAKHNESQSPDISKQAELSNSSIDESLMDITGIRKSRTVEMDDKKLLRKLKAVIGTTGTPIINPNAPSNAYKSANNSISKKVIKKYQASKSQLDSEFLDQAKLSQRKDDKISEILKDQKFKNSISSRIKHGDSPTRDLDVTEAESRIQTRIGSPMLRKTRKNSKVIIDMNKLKELKLLKLPSITGNQDPRGRLPVGGPVFIKKNSNDTVPKIQGNNGSLSPLKTEKDLSPPKDTKNRMFANDKLNIKGMA
jgi:hypothetical protein